MYYNYMPGMGMNFNQFQRQEVIRVNGENGARAMGLAPNSSALVLDETAPIVWLCQTDGAGYKTCTAYKITPVQQEQQETVRSLEERIKRLEALINGKPDTQPADAGGEQ